MKIQLLHFPGCPNVDAARAAVREALDGAKVDATLEEIDMEDPAAPGWTRGWGSPTILIDGKDVAGQQRSNDASACRLYPGGAPSVTMVRDALVGNATNAPSSTSRIALPMVGALGAAVAASACCIVPAVLAVVGVSGAGFAARFAPFRIPLLVLTGLALAVGFWLAYRRQKDACGCSVPKTRKAARVGLWVTSVITVVLAAYPTFAAGTASAGSQEAAAKATLTLRVIGMDCAECTSGIAKRIKKVPGVVSATVNFEAANALVRHDGREGMASAAIKAVEDAGFRAEVAP